MNIIADVAGQYNALVMLLAKMPKERTVFLGDLIDRGRASREVVDLVRRGGYECVLANHEHMMIDFVENNRWYEDDIWLANGGRATLASYGAEVFDDRATPQMKEDVEWMKTLPLYIETDKLFLSHAPWRHGLDLKEASRVLTGGAIPISRDDSLIWCRDEPQDRLFEGKRKVQVFGHNSYWGIRKFLVGVEDGEHEMLDAREQDPYYLMATSNPVPVQGELFALCIDNSWMQKVTGLHVDDETGAFSIYQEKYA